jgi:hypothetical protein
MQFLRSIFEDTFTGLIGAAVGFVAKVGWDFIVRRRREQIILDFFGFSKGEILIIHSALFDRSREAYNYPSCDMISARRLANLLEEVGKKEGLDFTIAPEADYLTVQGTVNPEVWRSNLILLGGPKRNKVAQTILDKAARLRYTMSLAEDGENRLYDNLTRQPLVSSRDRTPSTDKESDMSDGEAVYGYDYGLIMSMPNLLHLERGVLLVAGIHGPGTVGAAAYLADKRHLTEMARKRKGGMAQQVICAKYEIGIDRVVDVTPV